MSKKIIYEEMPAYPTIGYTGMDIRTAIAMDMAKGILAGRRSGVSFNDMEINTIINTAIILADKLIKELNKA